LKTEEYIKVYKLDNCVEEFVCCPYCGARMDGKPE
jgi:uncharacterized Zn-finger protein